jgi:hypothetical protein
LVTLISFILQPHLIAKPSLITTQWAQNKIAAIVQPFLDHKIDSKEKLLLRWYEIVTLKNRLTQ